MLLASQKWDIGTDEDGEPVASEDSTDFEEEDGVAKMSFEEAVLILKHAADVFVTVKFLDENDAEVVEVEVDRVRLLRVDDEQDNSQRRAFPSVSGCGIGGTDRVCATREEYSLSFSACAHPDGVGGFLSYQNDLSDGRRGETDESARAQAVAQRKRERCAHAHCHYPRRQLPVACDWAHSNGRCVGVQFTKDETQALYAATRELMRSEQTQAFSAFVAGIMSTVREHFF